MAIHCLAPFGLSDSNTLLAAYGVESGFQVGYHCILAFFVGLPACLHAETHVRMSQYATYYDHVM